MNTIVLVLFCLAMIANVIALVRHHRMMRALEIALNSLMETQRQFDEAMRHDRR